MEIEKILNDVELFWKYILGNKCKYCKAFKNKPKYNSETIEDVQEGNSLSDQEKKIAMLKAKLQKKKEEPSQYVCASENCYNFDFAEKDKVIAKKEEIENDLKVNIDFWNKNGYNISGNFENDIYYVTFKKNDIEYTYNSMSEVFNKNSLVNSKDIIMMSEYFKIINR